MTAVRRHDATSAPPFRMACSVFVPVASMISYQQIREQLGDDVVRDVEDAVSRAVVASWAKDPGQGDAALQALLVCMLASVIGTFDRTYESEYRAAQCSDMLARIIEYLPRH